MAEWSIAAVLKTVDPQGSGGSNPSLSASFLTKVAQFQQVLNLGLLVALSGNF